MLIPRCFEAVITFRGLFDGVLNFGGDAGGAPEPIDHYLRRIEMLRLCHLEVSVRLADIFSAFGAVYLDARRGAGALADQFTGEVEVGNASSFDAEVFHIFLIVNLLTAQIVALIHGQTNRHASGILSLAYFLRIWLRLFPVSSRTVSSLVSER